MTSGKKRLSSSGKRKSDSRRSSSDGSDRSPAPSTRRKSQKDEVPSDSEASPTTSPLTRRKSVDNIASNPRDPNFDPRKIARQQKQQQVDDWTQKLLKQGDVALPPKKLPVVNRNAPEVDQSIQSLEKDSVKTSNDYKFGNIDDFLDQFKPIKQPKIYIMEGDYPDDKTRKKIHGQDLADKIPLNIDRSLDRVADRSLPLEGLDDQNHGITVGSLVYSNYPKASVSLDVSFGHPELDWSNQFKNASPDVRQQLSIASLNLTFQTFFEKLLKQDLQGGVINLSQMVQPTAELEDKTVQLMEALAAKNNVIVLAMGNQSTKSDQTPAYQRLHVAIDRINKNTQNPGAIVLAENLKDAFDTGIKKGTAVLEPSSNYVVDPAKKVTTLAVRGQSPEVKEDRMGVGSGTSYSAPKLAALISKLTTAVSTATGQPVNGKDVIAALVKTADNYTVKKTSKFTDTGEAFTGGNIAPEDTFIVNVPNGDKALKFLLGDQSPLKSPLNKIPGNDKVNVAPPIDPNPSPQPQSALDRRKSTGDLADIFGRDRSSPKPASSKPLSTTDQISSQDNTVADTDTKIQITGKTKRQSPTQTTPRKNIEIEAPPKPRIDLTRLKNPAVRQEAAKLAARLDKFQTGLELAQIGGYKVLSGISVEAKLQKIFDLADANNDPNLLRQFSNATSFSGKLSLFQPTTEAGRAKVRLTQLLNAVQGDGSYNTVQANINHLAIDAKTLRQMARDVNVLSGLDNAQYVDATRLLRTVGGVPAQIINENTREWYLEQASLMKAYRELSGKDSTMQKKLALTMLQSFAKAAPLGAAKAEELGAQVTPLLNDPGFYHRSAPTNPLLDTVLIAYCKDMDIDMGRAHLVDNARFREVLAREYAFEGVNTQIGSILDYERVLQNLFSQTAKGNFPESSVVLDITDLFKLSNLAPQEIAGMRDVLEKNLLDRAEKFLIANPSVDQKKFAGMMKNLQLGAMSNHKGVDVLLTPPFLLNDKAGESPLQDQLLKDASVAGTHSAFFNAIEHSMIQSGYRLDPIQARKAWLEVADPSFILGKYGIQMTELATSDGAAPKVFDSFKAFTDHPTFRQFEQMAATPNAPPYLKTLSKATANMLRGLTTYKVGQGGVDQVMQTQGLDEVLQTSYFRMLNAMASAILDRGDLVGFMNQVEVIQQQMATLVSLLEPYGANDFGDSIRAKLTSSAGPGGNPVIPVGLDRPGVQLNPSAMHCLASILSSVEALKKGNNLNVCVLKDHYYESAGAVTTASTYSVSQLDGDTLRSANDIGTKPLAAASIQGKKPLDVYICDFHHNISTGRNHYKTENLQHHVDELYRNKLVADKFTVAIDCTIDFVNSKDVQDFLTHNKDRIASGSLNVVLFRSAQKFDMFGMDNYYGGFSVNINDHKSFADFNQRMEAPNDQLKGPSLQGLSHIAVHASESMDEYRSALMTNTKRFYDALPPGLIWNADSTSAMQVSKTDDPNAVFLDIKFPGNIDASNAFMDRLRAFATEEELPLTSRASFGFATTNLNLIHGEKTRLTPGLEGPEIQDRYIAFFDAVYECANKAIETGRSKGLRDDDGTLNTFVAEQIRTMESPPKKNASPPSSEQLL